MAISHYIHKCSSQPHCIPLVTSLPSPLLHQPPTVVTRILGEFGDLDTIAPTYTEEEAAIMLQVGLLSSGVGHPLYAIYSCMCLLLHTNAHLLDT